MDYKIFDRQIFHIKYDRLTQNKSSFSKTYQLLWIANGTGNLHIDENVIPISGDQLFFIPIGTTYTIEQKTEIITIKIYLPQKHLKLNDQYLSTMLNVDTKPIKELVATYLYKYNKRADFDIEVESQELIKELLPLAKSSNINLNPVRDKRVLQTLEFIDKHTDNRFTVNDIAKSLHINPTYLSTLFKSEVGTTIVKYTNTLRLEAAISDIQHTDLSITAIAHKHGFADVRTLNELTKSRYQVTPMQIRHKLTSNKPNITENNFNLIIDNYRLDLNFDTVNEQNVHASVTQKSEQYINSFNTIAIGRAHDLLYANVQNQLVRSKKEMNFTYCRFHNIFGDEMNIVDIDFFERLKFNFQKPFSVIEFLLENKIIPFIEIGFFPKEIASGSPSVFSGYNVNVGGTINYELWEQLIIEFFTALKQNFPSQCFSMRFDFWNEIDIKAFWQNTKEDLLQLYELTYQCIKKIDSRFKVGGFNYGNFISDTTAIEADLDYLQKRGTLPDFLTIHSYPFYIDGEVSRNPDFAATQIKIKYIKDKLNVDLNKLASLKEKYNFEETYITEWNTSPLQREHLNDGLYKSSKIISEIINSNSHLVDGICYWTLSDEMAEFGYPVGEVHGGFGLITRNGIPKPAYYSFVAASSICGNILFKNQNSIIVQEGDIVYILLNNDIDYDRNYYTEKFGISPQTMEGNEIKINVLVSDLTKSIYQETVFKIDEHCDLDANFKHIHKEKNYLLHSEIIHLEELSKPHKTMRVISIDDKYENTFNLKPTHTTFIILEKIN